MLTINSDRHRMNIGPSGTMQARDDIILTPFLATRNRCYSTPYEA